MQAWTEQARVLFRKGCDDAYVALHLAEDDSAPLWIIGFHAQQAVEKYLKAVLSWRSIPFSFTHDIEELVGRLADEGLPLPNYAPELDQLTPYGAAFRYGKDLDVGRPEMIADVRKWLAAVRQWAESFVIIDTP